MKPLLLAAAALLLLAMGVKAWRSGTLQDWWSSPDARAPVPIVFDNGTVRQPEPPASGAPRLPPGKPVGAVRKCIRGDEVVYTNDACPRGMVERDVGGNVNVVSPTGGAPRPQPAPAEPGAARRGSLQEVLDMSPARTQALRDRRDEAQGAR